MDSNPYPGAYLSSFFKVLWLVSQSFLLNMIIINKVWTLLALTGHKLFLLWYYIKFKFWINIRITLSIFLTDISKISQGFAFYRIILIAVVDLILIENSFQNSYASKANSIDLTSLLPFNSHNKDQAKNEKVSLIDILPFP